MPKRTSFFDHLADNIRLFFTNLMEWRESRDEEYLGFILVLVWKDKKVRI